MPYAVTNVRDVYTSSSESDADALATHLNSMEDDGWTLVGVLPNHIGWDDKMEFAGNYDARLIFHR